MHIPVNKYLSEDDRPIPVGSLLLFVWFISVPCTFIAAMMLLILGMTGIIRTYKWFEAVVIVGAAVELFCVAFRKVGANPWWHLTYWVLDFPRDYRRRNVVGYTLDLHLHKESGTPDRTRLRKELRSRDSALPEKCSEPQCNQSLFLSVDLSGQGKGLRVKIANETVSTDMPQPVAVSKNVAWKYHGVIELLVSVCDAENNALQMSAEEYLERLANWIDQFGGSGTAVRFDELLRKAEQKARYTEEALQKLELGSGAEAERIRKLTRLVNSLRETVATKTAWEKHATSLLARKDEELDRSRENALRQEGVLREKTYQLAESLANIVLAIDEGDRCKTHQETQQVRADIVRIAIGACDLAGMPADEPVRKFLRTPAPEYKTRR